MHSARMLALRLLLPPVHRCPSSASDSRVSSHASAERVLGRLDSKYSDAMRSHSTSVYVLPKNKRQQRKQWWNLLTHSQETLGDVT
eukprot:scaffold3084_cov144-Cylindrotheca_fusiformis.AAC.15